MLCIDLWASYFDCANSRAPAFVNLRNIAYTSHKTECIYTLREQHFSILCIRVFRLFTLLAYTVCTTTTSTTYTSPSMSRPFNLLRNLLLFWIFFCLCCAFTQREYISKLNVNRIIVSVSPIDIAYIRIRGVVHIFFFCVVIQEVLPLRPLTYCHVVSTYRSSRSFIWLTVGSRSLGFLQFLLFSLALLYYMRVHGVPV